MSFYSKDLLEKVTVLETAFFFFFQRTSENTDFYLFVLFFLFFPTFSSFFSIFSVWIPQSFQ